MASANAGNFGRAAESLGLNTSTISRRIGRLEDELGLALFERGHSGVRLTAGGKAVMLHVRRALAELDAVRHSGSQNGSGDVGEIRLGVRLPPIGEPIVSLLSSWRERYANVILTVSEMNDRDLAAALEERRLDVALTSNNAVWHHAASLPLYRDRLLAAFPVGHHLAGRPTVDWDALRDEDILVQGWDGESDCSRIIRVLPRRWRAIPFARRKQTICLRPRRRGIWCHPGYCQPIRSRLSWSRV